MVQSPKSPKTTPMRTKWSQSGAAPYPVGDAAIQDPEQPGQGYQVLWSSEVIEAISLLKLFLLW